MNTCNNFFLRVRQSRAAACLKDNPSRAAELSAQLHMWPTQQLPLDDLPHLPGLKGCVTVCCPAGPALQRCQLMMMDLLEFCVPIDC